MTNEIALGISIQKMQPYNFLVLLSSTAERKLLEQFLKAVEFNPVSIDSEIQNYLINQILGVSDLEEIKKEQPQKTTTETKPNNPEDHSPTPEIANDSSENQSSEDNSDVTNKEQLRLNRAVLALAKVDILCIEYLFNASTLELIKQVKMMYPKMIIILILNNVRKELLEEMIKINVNAYLIKPLTRDVIFDKLKIILNRKDLMPKEVIGYKPKWINLKEIQIPPLSNVLSKVILFNTNKVGGSEELEQIISPDKSLSADLLRVANSAFYGRTGSIHTLKDAITLMGLKTINNIAIVKARRIFTQKLNQPIFHKYLEEFPILNGLIALDLTSPLKLKALNSEIFIHSVLYKIGMTILALNQPERYTNVLQFFEQGTKSLLELEKEEFNTDYIHMGVDIFKAWQFPISMQRVVKNQEFTIDEITHATDLDRLLRMASILALKLLGNTSEPDREILLTLLQFYNMEEDIISLFNEEYYTHIKSHPFFDMFVHARE
ncbi:MAG: HDOD domain-containing protein [Leptospiraceae bacterium]|nr:HDOD domain-containing protein [Leptospiraceae bacterium]